MSTVPPMNPKWSLLIVRVADVDAAVDVRLAPNPWEDGSPGPHDASDIVSLRRH